MQFYKFEQYNESALALKSRLKGFRPEIPTR